VHFRNASHGAECCPIPFALTPPTPPPTHTCTDLQELRQEPAPEANDKDGVGGDLGPQGGRQRHRTQELQLLPNAAPAAAPAADWHARRVSWGATTTHSKFTAESMVKGALGGDQVAFMVHTSNFSARDTLQELLFLENC
jgi:hypothetical protein